MSEATAPPKASLSFTGRNPDVLTCIANLSNDEVFTPPELANQMLDMVERAWADNNDGASIWSDSTVKFLDPATKSGVFLREITKRLVDGLADEIPDLGDRVDHILTKQVYGIGITELTALLARRSVYCSKWADGEHSIVKSFDNPAGNVWFERTEHTWTGGTKVLTADKNGDPVEETKGGKCKFCGAAQGTLDRGDDLESHAYAFIHTDDIKTRITELFGDDMQFDVIIGNPPYQMTGGGGGSNDSAIYHHFVRQAMTLEPRFLSMVVPSRWMAGGRGLTEFRAEFLANKNVRHLTDYENAKDVFPTVGIGGGACYFLWDRDNAGPCDCTFHRNGVKVGPQRRHLGEFDVFVRDPRSVAILHKVRSHKYSSFEGLVSGDTPFGLPTNFTDYTKKKTAGPEQVLLFANVGTQRVTGTMSRGAIKKNVPLIDVWKLFLPVAGSGRERERTGVDLVIGPSIVGAPGTVCTQTYLVAGPLASKMEVGSVDSYLRTRLVRFLISLRKPAQHVFKGMYRWVPTQTWDRTWTDEELYEKYGITKAEQGFIESMIRPMDPPEDSAK